jgi:hypothetical protein
MTVPLALDIDGSLSALAARRIELGNWQEAIRFGCSWPTWKRFQRCLETQLPDLYGTVCMGSGDFHHLSHLLLQRFGQAVPFDVVVLDNHPDNMRFPFGIHCGSWVMHAARLPQVRCIHVLGITSSDVSWRHAWENHLRPLIRGKVRYHTIGVDTAWARRAGLSASFSAFGNSQDLVGRFVAGIPKNIPGQVYLSIDKDVFSPEVARTNWDQGVFQLDDARQLIAGLAGRIIGSDITGEISLHQYATGWKRWLSAMDQQPIISPGDLAQWQAQQIGVNRQLIGWLDAAGA